MNSPVEMDPPMGVRFADFMSSEPMDESAG
jgi:hypothetical protein